MDGLFMEAVAGNETRQ